MLALKAAFWTFFFIIIYTYLFYTIILFIIRLFKVGLFKKNKTHFSYEPEVTLFVTAYNEKDYIKKKIDNSLQLNYPKNKLKLLWVTDGSDDGSHEILKNYGNVSVYHNSERKGKIDAMNRGMKEVTTPIVIFSDANTDLNRDAVKEIVKEFSDPRVGCVAGEKRIYLSEKEKAVSAGEGIYWKYESLIKKLESDINSSVGAAGELFAIRTELFENVEPDTILDDFTISLIIAKKGYKIKYAPKAIACEKASFSIKEELKRKIRIASGGFQTLVRMKNLLNIFKYGFLSFAYISHKVLRWIMVPFSFIMIFFINILIVTFLSPSFSFYLFTFLLQIFFYILALTGFLLKNKSTKIKSIFIPFYLFIMNYAVLTGMIRYLRQKHSVIWEKAVRS